MSKQEKRRGKMAKTINEMVDDVMDNILEDSSLCIIREALERHFSYEWHKPSKERT
jgi:hypothetical protein